MKQISPFDWIETSAQKWLFFIFLILTLTLGISLQALGSPLRTPPAPSGIVSFELARTLDRAREMVDSWGTKGRVYAGLNLGLDYLFLISYAMCIGLGCVLLARSISNRSRILYSIGMLLAWGQVGAGLLDALENYALIRVLLGTRLEHWPAVARWCAIPKFLIVALGLIFILLAAILALSRDRNT